MKTGKPTRKPNFEFIGPVYIRPLGRGIVLGGADGQDYLEDQQEGDAFIEVRIWRKREPKTQTAGGKP